MPPISRSWICWTIVILAALPLAETAAAGPVSLKGKRWQIAIEPETLGVIAMPEEGSPFVVSSAASAPLAAKDITNSERGVSWTLPALKLAVDMRLDDDDVLIVRFDAAAPGSFAWPIIDSDAIPSAYILPMFEGLYVPAADEQWGRFLTTQGAMTTTAGLSMPFWGMEHERHTLTCILTNPFNNELEFRQTGKRVGLKLTHSFTPLQKLKQFGFRIHLGDASPVTPARLYRRHLIDRGEFISLKQKIEKTPNAAKLLGAPHVYLWGDAFSVRLIQMLADAGLDRLWLGSADWDGLGDNDNMVREAISRGYLIGPYDSYHSIHAPDDADTWETAQFGRELYESGGVLKADGTPRKGFKQKGFVLSPGAARLPVEKRVSKLMNQFRCNSWFIDCDAFGDVFDDYSPDHPATQQEDASERLSRMAWIRDTYGAVIGSEGGSAYAAPVIHFAHGMMTPVIGWDDPDLMTNRSSPYYLGGYYPQDQPATFFKPVPMKAEHRRVYADPRFRLPLYEIVFHDSVVATHQWGYASLKFDDPNHARALLELLYNVPPLYHLNLAEWRKRSDHIRRQFNFFSPLHREAALLPMTDFDWLTQDRMVQRTRFGQALELVANFGDQPFTHEKVVILPQSLLARWTQTGTTRIYTGTVP